MNEPSTLFDPPLSSLFFHFWLFCSKYSRLFIHFRKSRKFSPLINTFFTDYFKLSIFCLFSSFLHFESSNSRMKLIPLLALFAVVCHSFSLFSSSTPKQYAEGEAINIKANGLTSVKTQTPYDLYHIPYPKVCQLLLFFNYWRSFLFFFLAWSCGKQEVSHRRHFQHEAHPELCLWCQGVKGSDLYFLLCFPLQFSGVVAGDLYLGPNDIDLYTSLITGEYLVHFMLDNLPAVMKIQSLGGTTLYLHWLCKLHSLVSRMAPPSVVLWSTAKITVLLVWHSTIISISRSPTTKARIPKWRSLALRSLPEGIPLDFCPASSLHHQSSTDFNDAAVKTGTLNSCSIGNLPVHILKNSNGDNNVHFPSIPSILSRPFVPSSPTASVGFRVRPSGLIVSPCSWLTTPATRMQRSTGSVLSTHCWSLYSWLYVLFIFSSIFRV